MESITPKMMTGVNEWAHVDGDGLAALGLSTGAAGMPCMDQRGSELLLEA